MTPLRRSGHLRVHAADTRVAQSAPGSPWLLKDEATTRSCVLWLECRLLACKVLRAATGCLALASRPLSAAVPRAQSMRES